MLMIALCILAVASPLVAARWPAGLVAHRWRWSALIWLALLVQIVIIEVGVPHTLASVLHVLTYAAAAAFLWLNRALPGVLIVGLGALSNGITIALNGGVLPASQAAVDAAGLEHGKSFDNSAVVEDPVLPWLGDVFAWPAPLPLANTFSVGDVIIVVGVVVAAWSGARRLGAQPVKTE
ncbi:MAG: hypothetical protein CVT64_01920 [Actinobacteria bacterium HGW-Actinobacteria-4]|nr:MAG: hypothetical protein CVT64_01920 [Actinobacteria bacterium HGW-Actinobacteria-4]